jgi:hypothetical protein
MERWMGRQMSGGRKGRRERGLDGWMQRCMSEWVEEGGGVDGFVGGRMDDGSVDRRIDE